MTVDIIRRRRYIINATRCMESTTSGIPFAILRQAQDDNERSNHGGRPVVAPTKPLQSHYKATVILNEVKNLPSLNFASNETSLGAIFPNFTV